jgi:type II secretory pathway predicted ATPase ExeA
MSPQESAAPGHPSAFPQRDFAAFRLTPDLRFVFPQAAHEAAYAALLDALSRGQNVLLATGDIGVGKTILARRMERALPRRGASVAYIAYPDLGFADLLQCLHAAFDLKPASAGTDAAGSVRLLAASRAAQRVILLDDADKCSAALLSGLQGLIEDANRAGCKLQAVLFGMPDLAARISAEVPRVAIAADSHTRLLPLSPEETATYIRHRLSVLGARQDVFSADAIEAIASYARGVPRLVNQACGRALLLAGPERDGAISQAMIIEAIGDCPAVALADPRVAAWATETTPGIGADPEPAATAAEPAAEAEAPPLIVVPEPEPAVSADTADPIDLEAISDAPLQLPDPPSLRAAARVSEPPAGRQRKRRQRPAPDRLRLSNPADREAAPPAPPGTAPRFAGFVPRTDRSRLAPMVESAGPIDTALKRTPSRGTGRHLLVAAGGVALVLAASAVVYSTVEPERSRAVRDRLEVAVTATLHEIRGAAAAIAAWAAKAAGPQ